MPHRRTLVAGSLAFHLILVLGLFVAGFWKVDRLDAPRHRIDLAVAAPPPPAPSGSPAGAKVEFEKKKPKIIPHDIVLPPKPDPETVPTPAAETPGTGEGSGSGSGSGSGDRDSTGTCTEGCGTAGPQPQKQEVRQIPKPPIPVIPSVLRGMRVAGETQIQPPDIEKHALIRSGKSRAMATVKVCVGETGSVTSLALYASSGYAGWDGAILGAIRSWRYKPHRIDDRAVAVCGMVTFIYEIH